MKLFDDYEVVKFPEENLLFVTTRGYIYFIYNPKTGWGWSKYKNAGNDRITVGNYAEVSKEELIEVMNGVFPQKYTDFLRLCSPWEINIRDMLALLKEDYSSYMFDEVIYNVVYGFLLESTIRYKSYLKLKDLLDGALSQNLKKELVVSQIKNLSLSVIGRDIFKKEIRIVDGHNSSSYFWIRPVRILDYSNTGRLDTVAEMDGLEISIEEDDVAQYLTPFLYKYFDKELEANKKRDYECWTDDNGQEQISYTDYFEWYLTHNFYTHEAVANILNDINDTIDALSSGKKTDYTVELKKKRGWATNELVYAKDWTEEEIKAYNDNRPTEDDTEISLIIDFYRRFVYRMEYMMTVGKENGFDLISFMGP